MFAAIASMAGSALNSYGNNVGANAASPYYQHAGDMLNEYLKNAMSGFKPYSQAGQQGLDAYQARLGQMANPQQYLAHEMAGYQNDPATQFQISQGTNAANAQAAASGLTGSSNNLDNVAHITQGLTAQGQQNYLNNLNHLNTQYLSGQGDLAHMGLNAAGNMGNLYARFGEDQADLAGSEAANAAQANGGILGALKNLPGGDKGVMKYSNPAYYFGKY